MKFDFTKAWNELTDEEQNAWDAKCQKSQTRKIKEIAKIQGIDFKACVDLCMIDSVSEWNDKHIPVLRKNCAAKYKPLLKGAQTLEEYNKIYAECAKELEIIGF